MELIKIDTSLFSKSKVSEVQEDLASKVISGELDALKVQMAINFYEKIFDGLKEKIKPSVMKAFDPYGKEAELHGFKLESAEAGVKYDYSSDPIWQSLNEVVEFAKEKLKTRETQLKALKLPNRDKNESNNMVLDPSTGELYEEFPPIKTSTSIVKFTLKR